VTGSADQRVGGRRGAAPLGAAVLLLCALVGVAPAGAAAATADAGTVVGWGANNLGQTSPPAGLTGVTAIAANGSRSLALKGDGTVVAWGSNWGGYSSPPAGLTGVTAIAASHFHSLAVQGPRYAWTGFLRPVDNPPAVNTVTAGRAIPITFTLGGDQGLDIFRDGYPANAAYPCDGSAPTDATEPTVTAGASGLSYDPATHRYTYVWKTDKAWAGTCRAFVIRLADGSPAKTATFRFTR
jgi:hypothetical protein